MILRAMLIAEIDRSLSFIALGISACYFSSSR
jgi:hypothetical protein